MAEAKSAIDPIDAELTEYGVEDCQCDGLAVNANDNPCVICKERVKYIDHTHYKGQLFHLYCLLLAVLRQLSGGK